MTEHPRTPIAPDTTGYADVNGLHLYYETYGDGVPLVLLHGGLLTIDLNYATLIPALAQQYKVIGIEFQGHGRTGDIDRPINPGTLAGDVVALLDHLGIERAHVLGHSVGGATALELAISHPERVLSVVGASVSVKPDVLHSDFSSPEAMATSVRMPTPQDFGDFQEAYARLSPHPEKFNDFLGAMSTNTSFTAGWSDEQLAGITAPVLIVMGDLDFTVLEHGPVMAALIPGAQLAVLPGTTHMQVTRRAELLPMLERFLS